MRRIASIFVLWAILICLVDAAQATVCRLPGLKGYENAASRAKRILPPETTNLNELAIYIERDSDGNFYFHSNYKSAGAEHATKIGHEPTLKDVEVAAQNIVWTEAPSKNERDTVKRAYLKSARIYVDRDIFDSEGSTQLNFGGRNEIIIIDRVAGNSTPGIVVNRNAPPPLFAERISGCCLNGRPPGQRARDLKTALEKTEVKEGNVRILSLVIDSATEAGIRNSRLNALDSGLKAEAVRAEADIAAYFAKNKGKDVIILGHVENGKFVIRGSNGEIKAELPISGLRELARQNDVLLVEMGCNTAGVGAQAVDQAAISIATRFNTVDAVRRLSTALEGSSNYIQVLTKLGAADFQVVVDARQVDKATRFRAQYFTKPDEAGVQVRVGDVQLTTRVPGALSGLVPAWIQKMLR